jgi:hypothetical protein
VSNSSSPRTPPKPGNRHPEAPILKPLNEGDQQRGEIIATATGGREGLERPFMQDARDLEREGGAARNPSSPIAGTRIFESVVPKASPTHTNTDQETFLTRPATIGLSPKRSPKPVPSRTSNPSIAKPSKIASQATRKSVAPRGRGDAKGSPSQSVVAAPCEEYTPDPRRVPSFGVRLVFFSRSAVSYSSLLICQILFLCLLLANSLATSTVWTQHISLRIVQMRDLFSHEWASVASCSHPNRLILEENSPSVGTEKPAYSPKCLEGGSLKFVSVFVKPS